jgi:Protein of unknown function (DUF3616)
MPRRTSTWLARMVVLRISSFILARVRVAPQGRPADSDGNPLSSNKFNDAVETTYRVSDLLKRAGAAAEFFGNDLNSANGLNIEGIAADGEIIWFGLRAPIESGNAFLVGGSSTDLFRAGHTPSKATPTVIPINLDGLGIRDLAMLPDKRLLVLAGAAHGQEVTFKMFVIDTNSRTARLVGPLPQVKQLVDGEVELGKAEAVTIRRGRSYMAFAITRSCPSSTGPPSSTVRCRRGLTQPDALMMTTMD